MPRSAPTSSFIDPFLAPLSSIVHWASTSPVFDHQLLDTHDRLRPDVHLISVGDHFDYGMENLPDVAAQGLAILQWLASHSPEQTTILLGNHDTVRVIEFAGVVSDDAFAVAQRCARELYERAKRHGLNRSNQQIADEERIFLARFPDIPAVGYAARDFSAFSTAQRDLVADLLLHNRCGLATVVALADGRKHW
jgi:hypothetical protein